MMKSYGTPASEGDVQRAQFLNYLKAPKPLQLAMQKFSPDSDAYRGIQNSMASAEEDLGTRLGMPAPARQWTMATAGTDRAGYGDGFDGTPGQTPPGARSLVERTVSGLPANHPLTQMLNPQAEADRKARAAERQAAQPAINARGVAGATFGEVNGQQMLVPQAGRYGEFQAATAALGLNGQMGVDRGAFEQKRSDLVAGQEKARRGEKFEAKKAATRSANAAALQRAQDMEDKILLETIKNHGINAPGIQDWMQANAGIKKEQAAYDEITAATRGKQPDEPVQIGQEFRTVGEWRQQLAGKPRPALLPYQAWQGSQGELGDPRFAGSPASAPATATSKPAQVDISPLAGKEKEAYQFFASKLMSPDPKVAVEARNYIAALKASGKV